jgi:hypothetical protein
VTALLSARPRRPLYLAEHVCITYGRGTAAETWRFTTGAVEPDG